MTALIAAAAWAALGYGLYFTAPDQQAMDDLDAGGRLSANLQVYLPYVALTLLVAALVLYGLLAKLDRLAPLLTIIAVVAVFALWVITRDYLLGALPQLAVWATRCLVIDLFALLPLFVVLARSAAESSKSRI